MPQAAAGPGLARPVDDGDPPAGLVRRWSQTIHRDDAHARCRTRVPVVCSPRRGGWHGRSKRRKPCASRACWNRSVRRCGSARRRRALVQRRDSRIRLARRKHSREHVVVEPRGGIEPGPERIRPAPVHLQADGRETRPYGHVHAYTLRSPRLRDLKRGLPCRCRILSFTAWKARAAIPRAVLESGHRQVIEHAWGTGSSSSASCARPMARRSAGTPSSCCRATRPCPPGMRWWAGTSASPPRPGSAIRRRNWSASPPVCGTSAGASVASNGGSTASGGRGTRSTIGPTAR